MNAKSTSVLRTALDILLLLVLALTSYLGFQSAWDDGSTAKKTGEFITVGAIFTYAVAGVVALIGLLRKRNWAWIFVAVWAAFSAIAGGLATIVYGEQGFGTGAVAAVATLLLIGLPCFYWVRKMMQRQIIDPSRSRP